MFSTSTDLGLPGYSLNEPTPTHANESLNKSLTIDARTGNCVVICCKLPTSVPANRRNLRYTLLKWMCVGGLNSNTGHGKVS